MCVCGLNPDFFPTQQHNMLIKVPDEQFGWSSHQFCGGSHHLVKCTLKNLDCIWLLVFKNNAT